MNNVLAELKDDRPKKDENNILRIPHQGYIISIGLNSFSNEKLIGGHPHKNCLWMHAMAARGSHVVLCIEGLPEPGEKVLQYAAHIALRYSHSEARTVSVAFLKDVEKPEGAKSGVFKAVKSSTVEVSE